MVAAGLQPLVEYPGSNNPWRCRCLRCLRVVNPRHGGIAQGQGGCRSCAKGGFDPSQRAVVYLVANADHGAVKVGIAALDGVRLKTHARYGWQALAAIQVPGDRAVSIERAILSWWRTGLGLPRYLGSDEMPQNGWTETVDADAIDIPATIARIHQLAAETPAA